MGEGRIAPPHSRAHCASASRSSHSQLSQLLALRLVPRLPGRRLALPPTVCPALAATTQLQLCVCTLRPPAVAAPPLPRPKRPVQHTLQVCGHILHQAVLRPLGNHRLINQPCNSQPSSREGWRARLQHGAPQGCLSRRAGCGREGQLACSGWQVLLAAGDMQAGSWRKFQATSGDVAAASRPESYCNRMRISLHLAAAHCCCCCC